MVLASLAMCVVYAQPVLVSPSSGSGSTQTFVSSFKVPSGAPVMNLLINNALDGRQACYLAFAPAQSLAAGTLYLEDDSGTAFAGSIALSGTPASQSAINNSHCIINPSMSSVTVSGNTVTLSLGITFTNFAGNKVMFLALQSASTPGWHTLGVWNVPGTSSMAVGLSPARTASATQNYSFNFTDVSGPSDLAVLDVLMNFALDGRQACYVAYVPSSWNSPSGTLYLVNDAGAAGGHTLEQ